MQFKQGHALHSRKKSLEILRFKLWAEAEIPLGTVSRYCLHQNSDLPPLSLTIHLNFLLGFQGDWD